MSEWTTSGGYGILKLSYPMSHPINLKQFILDEIHKRGELKVGEVIQATGFSRSYVSLRFQELRNEGKIVLVGQANRAIYVLADKKALLRAKSKIVTLRKILKNDAVSEDTILDELKRQSGIFLSLKPNVEHVLEYAFTELLNNAIEHSRSKTIEIRARRTSEVVAFEVIDRGVGIFRNIKQKKHLKNELEAVQDLLKGKQTTAPEHHSGEGIFFTSKLADSLVIESSSKKLLFNNIVEDIFLQDIRSLKGTKVIFTLSLNSAKITETVFKEFTGDSFEFSKTSVAVRLYKMGSLYVSRSQARRIMAGLTDFKTVTLDFNHIGTIGQAFADEVFRVWANHHPGIEILLTHANENVQFMIERAKRPEGGNPKQPSLFAA
jgi:anti-sigma regulatory factor (Ser/Thr protein kinase)